MPTVSNSADPFDMRKHVQMIIRKTSKQCLHLSILATLAYESNHAFMKYKVGYSNVIIV